MCYKRIITFLLLVTLFSFRPEGESYTPLSFREVLVQTLRTQVMKEAAWAMQQEPQTITAFPAARSAGSLHDFFSEADYFWPDPKSPDSPYINHDGMTNPDNFVAHRHAMIRFSNIVGALASAYTLTHEKKYLDQALRHCRAWFVDTATRMNPWLLYAQAIKGRVTGRGIGIIDTIHLMEVVQGLMAMLGNEKSSADVEAIRTWFATYANWLMTHPYGQDEMKRENNHGTCWVMQTALFAKFAHRDDIVQFCRDRFKNVLLPNQLAADGSFPLELKRTKPYGYSLFNLDATAAACQILSTPGEDLWQFTLPDGRNFRKAMEYMVPFIADKTKWPFAKDVMHWNEWPVAQPALFLGAAAYNETHWMDIWKRLEHQPQGDEVVRNLPIRHPLIWIP